MELCKLIVILGCLVLIASSTTNNLTEAAPRKEDKAVNHLPTKPPIERYCRHYPMMKIEPGKTRKQLCADCCQKDNKESTLWVLSSLISTYCYCKPKQA